MIAKTFSYLRIIYISCVVISIAGFIGTTLYTANFNVMTSSNSNITLERWSIILTLFGIFAALRLLHPKLKDIDKQNLNKAIKKYTIKYFARLIVLLSICVFNLISYSFIESKNFLYLAFITIFSLFLCAPNKKHIEEETRNKQKQL